MYNVHLIVELDVDVLILEIVLTNLQYNKASSFAMEPMKGQGGIQMLLNAEQEAQQIVSAAKNCNIFLSFMC